MECLTGVVRAASGRQCPALQGTERRMFHTFQRLQFDDGSEGLVSLVIDYEQVEKRAQDADMLRRQQKKGRLFRDLPVASIKVTEDVQQVDGFLQRGQGLVSSRNLTSN